MVPFENKSYKIYDLLDDAAKAELYVDASTPKYDIEFGTVGSYINDSGRLPGVPAGSIPSIKLVGKGGFELVTPTPQ